MPACLPLPHQKAGEHLASFLQPSIGRSMVVVCEIKWTEPSQNTNCVRRLLDLKPQETSSVKRVRIGSASTC